MALNGKKVLVVGAGVAGLCAALAMRRRGAEVMLLEQAEAVTEVGAGLQLSPNGVAVLRALGLEPALARNAVRARAVVLRDYRRPGDVLRLDLQTHAPDQAFYFTHRADLIDLLGDAVREAGVQVRLLQNVAEVLPGPTPAVRLVNGNEKTADLVIGADGLHSRARVALNGPDAPFFTGQVAWRAVVPNDMNLPAEARVYMGPGRHLVSYPLRQGRAMNIVAVQERAAWTAADWNLADDPDNLRHVFADFGEDARALLRRVTEVRQWGLFRHPVAATWHRDGVAILGDAAHPTLPFMAQGANMAFEDAWVLTRCLDETEDTAAALARYQGLRHQRATRVIGAANGNAWKYHLRLPPLRGAAHMALRLGGAVMPGRMVHQFDWLYGHDVTA